MRLSLIREFYRRYCNQSINNPTNNTIVLNGKTYIKDDYTNVTPRIISFLDKKLLHRKFHPLNLIKQNIINYFNKNFIGKKGITIFSIYEDLHPVVTVRENFDSLLIPESHISRQKSDTYYINKEYLLRSHTTAHQAELIKMGLDNFLIFGDAYRRDEIDITHYPVFHQTDGVYTLNKEQIENVINSEINLFENNEDTEEKQGIHTAAVTKFIENHLKNTLIGLSHHLYGTKISHQWVSAYFPFTHPSWELQIMINNEWTEILGCGIIRQDILKNAGAGDRVGWAFGLGLERLAMQRYQIPDIRIFWSEDSGVTSQFEDATPETKIIYKEVSPQPQCINDLSFFLADDNIFHSNDFYEIVRHVGGNYVEQVKLIDEFFHPKVKRLSRTYRIIYRHRNRPLTKAEVNVLHSRIANTTIRQFNIEIR